MRTTDKTGADASDARVATRQALRLPLPLAARLAAWCQMHPQRSRNQIIAELLDAALSQAEREWSAKDSAVVGVVPDPTQPIYLPMGPFADFRGLVHQHHLRLEHELDRDEPASGSLWVDYPLDDE